MSNKPIVVVCGATGAQGASVARHLLQDGGYSVRALTRNVTSSKAQALKNQGAEVIACDLGNENQVAAALQGAYGVFGLTNYWEHGGEVEIQQGKNLANAAKASGVKHFVWSSLPHVPGVEPGHWESKNEIGKYLNEIGVPTTVANTSSYLENVWTYFPLKKQSDGSLLADYFFPSDMMIPSFAAEDLGGWVLPLFKNPKEWIGKEPKLCVGQYTPRDYAKAMSEALGAPVALKEVSMAQFDAARGHVGHDDLWLNFKAFLEAHSMWSPADLDISHQLYPGAQDLKKFMENHKQQILDATVPA